MSFEEEHGLGDKKGRKTSPKSRALTAKKAGTPTKHMGKDCGYKCVFHNKGVKHE